jgi:hypothetical protein
VTSHIEDVKRNILGYGKRGYTYDRRDKEEGNIESPHVKALKCSPNQNPNLATSNTYLECYKIWFKGHVCITQFFFMAKYLHQFHSKY